MPDTGRADGAGFSIEMRAQGKRKMQQIHSLWWDAAGPMRAFRRLFFFFKKKKKRKMERNGWISSILFKTLLLPSSVLLMPGPMRFGRQIK